MGLTKGRFAPSPTGRMHLGNVFAALMSWLSARSKGGQWLLRIEDLDPQRSRIEYARLIEDDLHWRGLDWDEGGCDDRGPAGPYSQSRRGSIYAGAFDRLRATGLTYPCTCTRADIMATQAPHQTDGRIVYAGTCRPATMPCHAPEPRGRHATRIYVPDREISFNDTVFGTQSFNLASECGDFVLQRADGAWAYQLAVVVDDAMMGVTEVVRGCDLLLSAAQQLYLYDLLGYAPPRYAHVPLLCAADGRRLSKRDAALGMDVLRSRCTADEIIGRLAWLAGLQPCPTPRPAASLVDDFDISRLPSTESIICN
ncbi:MAG: tRNA glutamyl-Q(34) synthetase GluQRS [Muribaculaceae bacterium]|nr:tRNA glutamyl-Q(34) synthetase GluQRS [Muribaculaceae bacterium]